MRLDRGVKIDRSFFEIVDYNELSLRRLPCPLRTVKAKTEDLKSVENGWETAFLHVFRPKAHCLSSGD